MHYVLLSFISPRRRQDDSNKYLQRITKWENNLGVTPWEIVSSDMYPQRRFRSACAFLQSDQNLHWTYFRQPTLQSFFMRTTNPVNTRRNNVGSTSLRRRNVISTLCLLGRHCSDLRTYMPSEDSDETAHLRSLIRIFAGGGGGGVW